MTIWLPSHQRLPRKEEIEMKKTRNTNEAAADLPSFYRVFVCEIGLHRVSPGFWFSLERYLASNEKDL